MNDDIAFERSVQTVQTLIRPTIAANPSTTRFREGQAVTVTVTLSQTSLVPPIVEYTITPAATMGAIIPNSVTDNMTEGRDIAVSSLSFTGTTLALFTINAVDDTVFEGDEQFIVEFRPSPLVANTIAPITFTIEDNEPVVSIAQIENAAEPGMNGTLRLNITNPIPFGGIAVPFNIGSVTGMAAATVNEDFRLLVGNQTFTTASGSILVDASADASTTRDITVSVINDFIAEGDEVFTVTLGADMSSGFGVVAGSVATVTVQDNDIVPTATLRATGMPAETGTQQPFSGASTPGTFVIELTDGMGMLSPALGAGATVSFTASSTTNTPYSLSLSEAGMTGFGFSLLSGAGSVTIPQGQSTANIVLTPTDDAIVNIPPHIVTISLADATAPMLPTSFGYSSMGASALLAIDDNDSFPKATISADQATIREGDSPIAVRVNLSNSAQLPTIVSYTVSGSATNGADFSSLPGTLSIGQGLSVGVVNIIVTDDSIDENDEAFVVQLTGGGGVSGYDLGSDTLVTVTLQDNDTAGISVSPASILTSEGGSMATFAVALTSQPTSPVTLNFAGLDATEGSLSASALMFGSGNWNLPQTITVTGVDDDLIDNNQTYTLSLTPSSTDAKYSGLTDLPTVMVTNQDNDNFGVTVSGLTGTVAEGASTAASYTLNLNRAPSAAVTIAVDGGMQLLVSTDNATFGQTLTFSKSDITPQTIFVRAVDDQAIEGLHSGTISHSISGTTDANYAQVAQIGILSQSVGITDNDLPRLIVEKTNNASEQSLVTGKFNLLLVDPNDTDPVTMVPRPVQAPNNITFSYTVSGTAMVPADYDIDGLGTGTIAGGQTGATIAVLPVNDQISEPGGETVVVTLNDGMGYVLGLSNMGTVTITDDDRVGVSVSRARLFVTEGMTEDSFQVSLTSQPTADVTITLNSPGDLMLSASALMFDSGNWQQQQVVTIQAVNDSIDKGDRAATIGYTVSSMDGAYNGFGVSPQSVSIQEDDKAGIVVLRASDRNLRVEERGPKDTFTISLSSEPIAPVTISFSENDSNGLDFTTSVMAVTFNASNWNQPQVVTLEAIADDAVEAALESSTLAFSVTSGDSMYSSLQIPSLAVGVVDVGARAFQNKEAELLADSLLGTLRALEKEAQTKVAGITGIPVVGSLSSVGVMQGSFISNDFTNKLRNAVALAANPAALVQEINKVLPPGFSLTGTTFTANSQGVDLKFVLNYDVVFAELNLAANVGNANLGVEVDGKARLGANASLGLGFGLDFSSPLDPKPYLQANNTFLQLAFTADLPPNAQGQPFTATGFLGPLRAELQDDQSRKNASGTDGTKLGLEMKANFGNLQRVLLDNTDSFKALGDKFQLEATATADLLLKSSIGVGEGSSLPKIRADIDVGYNGFKYVFQPSTGQSLTLPNLTAGVRNVQFDVGSWLTNQIKPLFRSSIPTSSPLTQFSMPSIKRLVF